VKKVEVKVLIPIEIEPERERLFHELKDALKRAEKIANDGRVKMKTRLEAFRLVGYIASILAGMLKDFQMDEIQRKLMELEEELKREKSWRK
jgi:hypothetical protein